MDLMVAISLADVMIFACIVMIGISVFIAVRILFPESFIKEIQKRAAEQENISSGSGPANKRILAANKHVHAVGGFFVEKIGDRVNYIDFMIKQKWREKMSRRFIAMGRSHYRPQDFRAQQILYGLLFGLLGVLILYMLNRSLWFVIPFCVFGIFFPYIWLRDQIQKRQYAIARALPYHIDLLTLSVEAGLDFPAALATVVEKGRGGPLLEEFSQMLHEIRLGKTRAEALRNLADRIQLPEVSTFVSNLIQADKMGTSIGKVLRIQSTQMRVARTQRAEKLANEAPVKMLLPLIGCIFPTVFFILFGPLVYRWMIGG